MESTMSNIAETICWWQTGASDWRTVRSRVPLNLLEELRSWFLPLPKLLGTSHILLGAKLDAKDHKRLGEITFSSSSTAQGHLRESQLGDFSDQIDLWTCLWQLSWLMIDGAGLTPLWAVLSLGRCWFREYIKCWLIREPESKPVNSVPPRFLFHIPAIRFLPWDLSCSLSNGLCLGGESQKKPFSPQITFGHGVYRSNRKQRRILLKSRLLTSLDIHISRRVKKLDLHLSLSISISLKLPRDLIITPETSKSLEENIYKNFEDIGIDKNFLKKTPIITGNDPKNC